VLVQLLRYLNFKFLFFNYSNVDLSFDFRFLFFNYSNVDLSLDFRFLFFIYYIKYALLLSLLLDLTLLRLYLLLTFKLTYLDKY